MLRPIRAALVAALVLSAAACAELLTGGELIRPGEPTGTIVVANGSSRTVVVAVLISNCNASTYGLNRLPSGVNLPPGRSYSFTVSAGCWDVDAGSMGAEARQRMQVRPGGGVRYTVTD
ncbi:hypothetical protein QO010_003698 [Caulobacter ginsengisoli]|uniref:Lipoprotein n=1 Tax=Caulobacter ginsengisoli TaxID=400775 RepID=A0ABU0IV66_9CAUL|nr:hypothetical protein [Caulobacter ginsengisoli]MDQ0465906.1 hypothetical protein [Caulobacter ginsengisoli]